MEPTVEEPAPMEESEPVEAEAAPEETEPVLEEKPAVDAEMPQKTQSVTPEEKPEETKDIEMEAPAAPEAPQPEVTLEAKDDETPFKNEVQNPDSELEGTVKRQF